MKTGEGAARRAVRVAAAVAVGAAAIAVAVTAVSAAARRPAGPSAALQRVTARLSYVCRYPSGPLRTPVAVTASFPASDPVGRLIRLAGIRVTVSIPPPALAGLGGTSAGAVTAEINLGIRASQGHRSVSLSWHGSTAHPTLVPSAGSLVLDASGPGPAVATSTPGPVPFTAAGLSMLLTPGPATQAVKRPAGQTLNCTLVPGQQTVLAQVAAKRPDRPGRPGPGGPTTPAAGGPAAPRHTRLCPAIPKQGLKLNKHFPIPKPPKGIKIHHSAGLGCAWIVGYSDVRKLHGAALIGPGITAIDVAVNVDYNFKTSDYFQEDSAGQLDYKPCPKCKVQHALPPAKATFLAFGFMPTTATMQLTQVGTLNIIGLGTTSALKKNTAWSDMSLRIYHVRVNGTPLNVGADCRTVRPIQIALVGLPTSHPPYSLQTGGPLTGKIKIPPFTHCGVGENLDPIFTGSISGPGNFVKLTQGSLCTPSSHVGCPARKPKPLR
jgi:hypothetical protein